MRLSALADHSAESLFALRRRLLPYVWQVPFGLWLQKGLLSAQFAPSWSFAIEDRGGGLKGYLVAKRAPEYAPSWRAHIWDLVCVDVSSGEQLLQAMLTAAQSEGVQEVRFGEDGEHLFCGLPVEFVVQREALLATGFTVDSGAERVDLLVRLKPQEEDSRVATLWITPPYRTQLEAFVAKEFPGRWTNDVRWMNSQVGELPCAVGLYEKGELIGFAIAQREGLPFRCGGANWAQLLGEGWSALGPLGVAESHRKGGYGRALMVGAMQRLLEAGSDRCIVDWTSLTQFYERFGFRIWKRYLPCGVEASTLSDIRCIMT